MNMTLKSNRLGLAITFSLIFLISVFSSSSEATEAGSQDRDPLSILVEPINNEISIIEEFNIDFKLSNSTEKIFNIDSISLLDLPNQVLAIRNRSDNSLELIDDVKEIRGYSIIPDSFKIHSVETPFYEYNLSTLFFESKTYPAKIRLRYHRAGGPRLPDIIKKIDLIFNPPLAATVFGGILGALLLGLFAITYELVYSIGRRTVQPSQLILQGLGYTIGGSVVSTISILLLNISGTFELPITIDVKDYRGGIFVGLLSYKIGDSLYQQLFGTGNKNSS